MPKESAGLLMYRRREGRLEVLLGHPGGPYSAKKDLGVWTIPKGELDAGEEPIVAARREFHEETGFEAAGMLQPLGSARQPSGKLVHAWAFEGDCDPASMKSVPFALEWPPRSGHEEMFPELDRCAWFPLVEAEERILRGQKPFLRALEALVAGPSC
jgi:predicted NUDIX family NTP pyrophosphohydrolase